MNSDPQGIGGHQLTVDPRPRGGSTSVRPGLHTANPRPAQETLRAVGSNRKTGVRVKKK